MTSILDYHVVIWRAQYSLFIKVDRNLVFLSLLVRMLDSSIVDDVAGMLLRWLMPLMCVVVGDGRIVLLGVAVFIGLHCLQLVVSVVPIGAHWGPLVCSRIVNWECVLLVVKEASWWLVLEDHWRDCWRLTGDMMEGRLKLISWRLVLKFNSGWKIFILIEISPRLIDRLLLVVQVVIVVNWWETQIFSIKVIKKHVSCILSDILYPPCSLFRRIRWIDRWGSYDIIVIWFCLNLKLLKLLILMINLLLHFFIIRIKSLAYHGILWLIFLAMRIVWRRLRLLSLSKSLLVNYCTLMVQGLL